MSSYDNYANAIINFLNAPEYPESTAELYRKILMDLKDTFSLLEKNILRIPHRNGLEFRLIPMRSMMNRSLLIAGASTL